MLTRLFCCDALDQSEELFRGEVLGRVVVMADSGCNLHVVRQGAGSWIFSCIDGDDNSVPYVSVGEVHERILLDAVESGGVSSSAEL